MGAGEMRAAFGLVCGSRVQAAALHASVPSWSRRLCVAAQGVRTSSAAVEPTMFAVVSIKGKQYKASDGDVIMAEKLDAQVGTQMTFDDVLLIGKQDGTTMVGKPTLEGASVTMAVQEQTMTEKVHVFKKKRRKNYRRFNSHRQNVTMLRVHDIASPK